MRIAWICHECGIKHGRVRTHLSTFHKGECECCGEQTAVTEGRDYGVYLITDNKTQKGQGDAEETV